MFCILALAKEEVSDADMAEMILSEIETLSSQLKELEENIKVFFYANFENKWILICVYLVH